MTLSHRVHLTLVCAGCVIIGLLVGSGLALPWMLALGFLCAVLFCGMCWHVDASVACVCLVALVIMAVYAMTVLVAMLGADTDRLTQVVLVFLGSVLAAYCLKDTLMMQVRRRWQRWRR